MPIRLFRVDDRLIHGQVVVGWGNRLAPDRYLVVDDELAGAEWEQELYSLSVPEGASVEFWSVEEARERLPEWRSAPETSILLSRNVESMLRLARGGTMRDERVTLGGIHHGPGRTKVLSYVYLDPADRGRLVELRDEGVGVEARDLPGSAPVELERLLS